MSQFYLWEARRFGLRGMWCLARYEPTPDGGARGVFRVFLRQGALPELFEGRRQAAERAIQVNQRRF